MIQDISWLWVHKNLTKEKKMVVDAQAKLSQDILSDITVHMKYARYIPEINRRETWEELVERNIAMHVRKYPQMKDEIQKVYKEFVQIGRASCRERV